MEGTWNGEKIKKEGKFKSNVTFENVLIARTLNLNDPNKYIFDLIQIREFPELKSYEMYFQVVGEEEVTVKAGKYKCKKVKFSLTDWRGWFYSAYYYISDDEHHYIVKMENMPPGGYSELIKIEN